MTKDRTIRLEDTVVKLADFAVKNPDHKLSKTFSKLANGLTEYLRESISFAEYFDIEYLPDIEGIIPDHLPPIPPEGSEDVSPPSPEPATSPIEGLYYPIVKQFLDKELDGGMSEYIDKELVGLRYLRLALEAVLAGKTKPYGALAYIANKLGKSPVTVSHRVKTLLTAKALSSNLCKQAIAAKHPTTEFIKLATQEITQSVPFTLLSVERMRDE